MEFCSFPTPKFAAGARIVVCDTVQTMASRSVNKVILLGHLGKDAETKFTPCGIAKTSFTLATNRRWKDQQTGDWKEETDWHNIVLWRIGEPRELSVERQAGVR